MYFAALVVLAVVVSTLVLLLLLQTPTNRSLPNVTTTPPSMAIRSLGRIPDSVTTKRGSNWHDLLVILPVQRVEIDQYYHLDSKRSLGRVLDSVTTRRGDDSDSQGIVSDAKHQSGIDTTQFPAPEGTT
ncbi:hypothetical protein EDB19DRAFT_932175 [Suillus lakei]|nr:hypothetical protein EDB19DRAFT_932175 [Suillus lakei]